MPLQSLNLATCARNEPKKTDKQIEGCVYMSIGLGTYTQTGELYAHWSYASEFACEYDFHGQIIYIRNRMAQI